MSRRLGMGAWSAFERTVYADVLAGVFVVLIFAALYFAGCLA